MPRRVQKLSGTYNVTKPTRVTVVKSAVPAVPVEPKATTDSTVNPSKGYRLLNVYETLEEGDECLSTNGVDWYETCRIGRVAGSGFTYRRKLKTEKIGYDPGEGYRLLTIGETLEEGDEFRNDRGWRKTTAPGHILTYNDLTYRRPLTLADGLVGSWSPNHTKQKK